MNQETREALDAYYHDGESWAADRVASIRRSRRTAWIVAALAMTIAVLEAVALIVLTPLKTVVPYTLLVDRHTGYVQALDPLEPATLAPDKALTQSFLVQYVIARESFDIDDIQENFRKVGLWSSGTARSQYVAAMQASNPDSPLDRYPRTAVLETSVKSVSPLNGNSALVRFETVRRDQEGAARVANDWIAVVRYRFAGEPMQVADRYLNPLGFQVIHYRKDREALPVPAIVPSQSSSLSPDLAEEATP